MRETDGGYVVVVSCDRCVAQSGDVKIGEKKKKKRDEPRKDKGGCVR